MGTTLAITEIADGTGSPLGEVTDTCGPVAESGTLTIVGKAVKVTDWLGFCGAAMLFSALCRNETTLLEMPAGNVGVLPGACGDSVLGCCVGEAMGITDSTAVAFKAVFSDAAAAGNGAERPDDAPCAGWPN